MATLAATMPGRVDSLHEAQAAQVRLQLRLTLAALLNSIVQLQFLAMQFPIAIALPNSARELPRQFFLPLEK